MDTSANMTSSLNGAMQLTTSESMQPMPEQPLPHVAAWAYATDKKFEEQVVTGHGKPRHYYYSLDEKGQVDGDVPAADSADWFQQVVEGLVKQGIRIHLYMAPKGTARWCCITGSAFASGPTLNAALCQAVLALKEGEAK